MVPPPVASSTPLRNPRFPEPIPTLRCRDTRRNAADKCATEETETDDATAVRRARDGDLDAYEVLVARHTALAHRTAVLLGAGDDADDVIQTAFVKAYQALHRFNDAAPFRPWLLRIVANETHNLTRGRGRRDRAILRAAVLAETAPEVSEPPDLVVAAERRKTLLAAVRELPEKERLVVTCRYLLDLSEAETAATLGWPRGSVKSRLSRALRRLKAELGEAAHV